MGGGQVQQQKTVACVVWLTYIAAVPVLFAVLMGWVAWQMGNALESNAVVVLLAKRRVRCVKQELRLQ